MKPITFYLIALSVCISACSTPIHHYEAVQPVLDAKTFFNGKLTASGIVKNYQGRVVRSFHADIRAYWRNDTGTLEEDFIFNDGEKQRRIWTLTPTQSAKEPHLRYYGTASDVSDKAKIYIAGNAMFLKYRLNIPYQGTTLAVTVDDKMFLSADGVIINESKLYKFGLKVGEIVLTIYKN